MKRPFRVAQIAAAAIALAAAAVWMASGREGFTRWPNAKLEAADAPLGEEAAALFDDIGLAEPGAPASGPALQSRFALGLLPGGFDPRHLLSVLTLLLLAGAVSASAWIIARTNQGRNALERSHP